MELSQFIGKTVIHANTKQRFILSEITAPRIFVTTERADQSGYRQQYSFPTINGDPISTGALVFEDPSLKTPFLAAYDAHCRSETGWMEEYGYWMRRD